MAMPPSLFHLRGNMELATYAAQVIEAHIDVDGRCNECTMMYPCPEWRLAEDWQRQRADLARAFKNRTGRELFELRKYACAMCSKKDTGLVCAECVAEAEEETDGSTDN